MLNKNYFRIHATPFKIVFIACLLILLMQCGSKKEKKTLEVTATAYNSLPEQTSAIGGGVLTAWGDTLKEGMKCIAVSHDLIDSGLTHLTKVWIEGLEGAYIVNDKMNRKWKRKIDIYFGTDKKGAREWGKRKVIISWLPEEDMQQDN